LGNFGGVVVGSDQCRALVGELLKVGVGPLGSPCKMELIDPLWAQWVQAEVRLALAANP
jgi:hypothetical protein